MYRLWFKQHLRPAGPTGRDGERVEIEVQDGDILVRRQAARVEARKRAEEAAERIIAERKNYTLGDITIRELIEEGRRH
jgi:hypothetical protein